MSATFGILLIVLAALLLFVLFGAFVALLVYILKKNKK